MVTIGATKVPNVSNRSRRRRSDSHRCDVRGTGRTSSDPGAIERREVQSGSSQPASRDQKEKQDECDQRGRLRPCDNYDAGTGRDLGRRSPMIDLPPSIDDSPELKALPFVLSVVAGSADVVSFLGLGSLFVAHITGNVIILAAHVVDGTRVGISTLLSVPVFALALILVRLLIAGVESVGRQSLRPLLVLQAVLLIGFTACALFDGQANSSSAGIVVAGMLGVCAMAAQNALAQASLRGSPSTAVMTTNLTRFAMDVGEILLGRDDAAVTGARRRAAHTWPALVGFVAGATAGAAFYAASGLWSLVLPAAVATVALAATPKGEVRTAMEAPTPTR